MKNKTQKVAVFYKSNGRWTPITTDVKRQPKTFTSQRELTRFLNSWEFNYVRNNVLKSAVTVRKVK
jgi:hypothetical protein